MLVINTSKIKDFIKEVEHHKEYSYEYSFLL